MLNRSDVEAAARGGGPPYLVAPLRVDIQHHVLDALVIATVVCAVRVLVGRQDAGVDWQPPPYVAAVAVGWWVFVVFFARRLYPSYHRYLEAMDTLGAELLPEATVQQRRAALSPPRPFYLPVYFLQWPRLYLLIRLGSVVYFPYSLPVTWLAAFAVAAATALVMHLVTVPFYAIAGRLSGRREVRLAS
ncbi:MAG: hypothetical protein M3P48_05105 [Actinomycetota bacterium]|nr:hypothetical protein [Actinomycetota bacterium]